MRERIGRCGPDIGSPFWRVEFGRAAVEVKAVYDDSPEFDWLGKFADFVESPETYWYHLGADLVWDGRFWRDDRGRIAAEPEFAREPGRRECRGVDIGSCQFSRTDKHSLTDAFQNGRRLRGLASNDWYFVGVVATVYWCGVDVAYSSLGGIESDSGADCFWEVAREVVWQALQDARAWRERAA